MRKYLATLGQRSEGHKKRFALAVSGCFTLLIFGIWTVANFGPEEKGPTLSSDSQGRTLEVSPFESFQGSVASSFDALKGSFSELKSGFNSINQYVR